MFLGIVSCAVQISMCTTLLSSLLFPGLVHFPKIAFL